MNQHNAKEFPIRLQLGQGYKVYKVLTKLIIGGYNILIFYAQANNQTTLVDCNVSN